MITIQELKILRANHSGMMNFYKLNGDKFMYAFHQGALNAVDGIIKIIEHKQEQEVEYGISGDRL